MDKENIKKRKHIIILIIFILIFTLIYIVNDFSFARKTSSFYEELFSYLKNNEYENIDIEEEFLKENKLFDNDFICENITYSNGVLEFFNCTIEEVDQDYCTYDGSTFECFQKDLESNLNVEFQTDISNASYVNHDVIIDANITENSDLEIKEILYCNTTNKECIPNKISSDYTYELTEESDTSKVCIMAKYTNKSTSDIQCSYNYKIDKTNPSIEYKINGKKGDNNWYISDVEITDYKADDSLSGIKSFNITKSLVDYETTGENIIITAEDMAGNKLEEIIEIKVDKTSPIAGDFVVNGTVGNNGWYISDVSIEATGAIDNISGISTSKVDKSIINYETSGEKIILTTTDNAGHSVTKEMSLKIDKNKPEIAYDIIGTKGDNDWYISDVEIKNDDVTDNMSGVKSYDISKSFVNYETKGENIIIYAEDNAGNISQEILNIKIDKTAPIASSFNIIGTTGKNDWYTSDLNITSIDGTDDISGISTTKIDKTKIDYETNGEKVTLITTDNAGHSSTREIILKVDKTNPIISYDLSGTKKENDWYITNVEISNYIANDLISGINNYDITNNLIDYDTAGEDIIITAEDNAGNKTEEIIHAKVDLTGPIITPKNTDTTKVVEGTSVNTTNYFNTPNYGISGSNSITCNPENTINLAVNTYTIECTVKSLSGLTNTAYKTIEIIPNEYKLTDYINNNIGNDELYSENGIRYEGENPNNYITFNDEEWRIIGLFDTLLPDGTTKSLVKIIKSTPIDYNNDSILNINRGEADTYSWSTNNINNWEISSINSNLNIDYLNNSGVFLNNGIDSKYKNLIEEVTWNLGGISAATTANDFYTQERSSSRPSGQSATWNGKVGLMYTSDYLYGAKENVCSRDLTSREYETAECHEQNWLFILDDYEGASKYEWLMNTYSSHTYLAWNIDSRGYIYHNHVGHSQIIRPSVYISPEIIISNGNGSKTNPFIIK